MEESRDGFAHLPLEVPSIEHKISYESQDSMIYF